MIMNIENLSLMFAREKGIQDFSLNINSGDVMVILGPNGAGKTTLLETALGFRNPQNGKVCFFEGKNLRENRESVLQRLGFVGDKSTLYEHYTVGEMMNFVSGYYIYWNDNYCRELLHKFGLHEEQKIVHLSRGMKAKLSLILAISAGPDLLILDESTSGLDPKAREEVLQMIVEFVADGNKSVLFATHLLEEANAIATSLVIINNSRKVLEISMEELENSFVVFDDAASFQAAAYPQVQVMDCGSGRILIDCRADKELTASLLKKGARNPELKELYMSFVKGD
jgi:ABC-2 type transport system ATP-binding protein